MLCIFQNSLICHELFLVRTVNNVPIQGYKIFWLYMMLLFMALVVLVYTGVKCACCCCWQIQQACQINGGDSHETLVIEGFRFECASSRESLQRLCSQDGSGCHFRRATHDWWRPRPLLSAVVSKVKCLTEVTTAGRWETTSSADHKTDTKHYDPVWVLCSSF